MPERDDAADVSAPDANAEVLEANCRHCVARLHVPKAFPSHADNKEKRKRKVEREYECERERECVCEGQLINNGETTDGRWQTPLTASESHAQR